MKGEERMNNRFILIRYVLMLWLLCGACYTQSVASAATYTPQYASWGYKPLYSTAATQTRVVGSGHAGHSGATYQGIYSTANAAVVATSVPTYTFRTTSLYITSSGKSGSMYSAPTGSGPLRTSSWTDEDDPIGQVPDVPIGDAPWLILLLLAAGYIAFRVLYRTQGQKGK